jgi:hypothetical protein
MKAEMMNAVMQIVPDYIELTDRQTHAIRKKFPCLIEFVQCIPVVTGLKVAVGERYPPTHEEP